MKVVHIIGGGDVGGAKTHVLSLVAELAQHIDCLLYTSGRTKNQRLYTPELNRNLLYCGDTKGCGFPGAGL